MFKIFYANGSTYMGDPYLAPVLGVLVVVEDDPDIGRRVIHNADYYCWDNRGNGMRWYEADFAGMVDYLIQPGPKRVLIGRLVENCVFTEIYRRALADPDFKPKLANLERHHGRSA